MFLEPRRTIVAYTRMAAPRSARSRRYAREGAENKSSVKKHRQRKKPGEKKTPPSPLRKDQPLVWRPRSLYIGGAASGRGVARRLNTPVFASSRLGAGARRPRLSTDLGDATRVSTVVTDELRETTRSRRGSSSIITERRRYGANPSASTDFSHAVRHVPMNPDVRTRRFWSTANVSFKGRSQQGCAWRKFRGYWSLYPFTRGRQCVVDRTMYARAEGRRSARRKGNSAMAPRASRRVPGIRGDRERASRKRHHISSAIAKTARGARCEERPPSRVGKQPFSAIEVNARARTRAANRTRGRSKKREERHGAIRTYTDRPPDKTTPTPREPEIAVQHHRLPVVAAQRVWLIVSPAQHQTAPAQHEGQNPRKKNFSDPPTEVTRQAKQRRVAMRGRGQVTLPCRRISACVIQRSRKAAVTLQLEVRQNKGQHEDAGRSSRNRDGSPESRDAPEAAASRKKEHAIAHHEPGKNAVVRARERLSGQRHPEHETAVR